MNGFDRHFNPFVPELFEIASRNITLAKRIYELSKNEFCIFGEIKSYFESKEDNILNLAALISMDNFESDLEIKDLVNFQKSSDSMTRARARMIAIKRKCKKSDYSSLNDAHTFSKCMELSDLARYLMLTNFEGQMPLELILKFQESTDENVRKISRDQLLNAAPQSFVYKVLEQHLKNKDTHVASLSALLLLLKLPKQLSWCTLVELQTSSCAQVRSKARSLVLSIPKDKIQKEKLRDYLDVRNSNIRDIATELILKNFDHMFSGKEILELQKSPNHIIRGLGRDVALSLPVSRWIGNSGSAIKRAMSSQHFETRKLAVELNNKFKNEDELDKDALSFLAKYEY